MLRILNVTLLIGLLALGETLLGQKIIDGFSLQNANTKEMVSLKNYNGKQAVVLVFTSSHCAYSKNYVARLNQMSKEYGPKGVMFLAINSNDPAISQDDSFDEMAEQKPYEFPYLKDNDQSIAKQLSASKNPEAFILVPASGKFEVVYQGKIDDLPLKQENFRVPKQRYLTDALDSALIGKNVDVPETQPGGCSIKWIKD